MCYNRVGLEGATDCRSFLFGMKQFLADTSHIVVGVAVILSGWLSFMVVAVAVIAFLTYEVIQWIYLERYDIGKADRPHRAIKFFLIGLIGTAIFFSFDVIILRITMSLLELKYMFGG